MAKAKTTKRALTSAEKFDKQFAKLTDTGLILLQDARRGSFKASDITEYTDFMDCVKCAIKAYMEDTNIGKIEILVSESEDDDEDGDEEDCGCFCEDCEREECIHADDDLSDADGDEDFCEENADVESAVADLEKYWHDISDVNKPPFNDVAKVIEASKTTKETSTENTEPTPQRFMVASDNETMKNDAPRHAAESNNNGTAYADNAKLFVKPCISTFMFGGYTWNTVADRKPAYCGNEESAKYPIFTALSDPQTGKEYCVACACIRNNGVFHTELSPDVIRAYNLYVAMAMKDRPCACKNRYVKNVGHNQYALTYDRDCHAWVTPDTNFVDEKQIEKYMSSTITWNDVANVAMITVCGAYMRQLNLSFDTVITDARYRGMLFAAMDLFRKNYIAKNVLGADTI